MLLFFLFVFFTDSGVPRKNPFLALIRLLCVGFSFFFGGWILKKENFNKFI